MASTLSGRWPQHGERRARVSHANRRRTRSDRHERAVWRPTVDERIRRKFVEDERDDVDVDRRRVSSTQPISSRCAQLALLRSAADRLIDDRGHVRIRVVDRVP